MIRTAIIGGGHVGMSMKELFPDSTVDDITHGPMKRNVTRDQVQNSDLAFVCVPTPQSEDGTVDISAVREVCNWVDGPIICIKSTVPPGTTDLLKAETGKRIVMSPEYFGEFAYWTPEEFTPRGWPYVVVGGDRRDTEPVVNIFQRVLGPAKTYMQTTAVNAELTKYMENAWLACQVMFGYEFSKIAESVGANYSEVRELWGMDPRVSKWHTLVMDPPGFGGKCLPKDLSGIIALANANGFNPEMLRAVLTENAGLRADSQEQPRTAAVSAPS